MTRVDLTFPAVLALAIAASLGGGVALAAGPAPPPSVIVVPVQVKDVAPSYDFIGRVTAIQSVQLVPRITAFIEAEPKAQGTDVKQGDILFELQKTQYEAAVQAAQAQLDSAKAALRQAQLAYDRAAKLNKQGFEAQANLDQATATRDQDQANVMAAQANLAQAALNLSYTTIVAPIDGRIGAITLTVGNLVTPSTPALATINQMDPIRVVFSVSDRVLVAVEQKNGASAAEIAKRVTVGLILPDGSTYKEKGRVAFLNNQVDPQTGTVSVFADFPNPDGFLLPGSFVKVDVRSATPEPRPMIPVAAVQTDQSGNYVLTVGADNTVKQQGVTLGRQVAQDFIVSKGLAGGERVITDGLQRVHPGEKVTPQVAPPAPAATAMAGG